jgi:shikimate kinase
LHRKSYCVLVKLTVRDDSEDPPGAGFSFSSGCVIALIQAALALFGTSMNQWLTDAFSPV